MSGQDAIRGFAVQTLVCLLDALRTGGPRWQTVTIEPDIAGDKVDLYWQYDGFTLAQQVKSSKNQIGRAAAEAWCQELKASRSANRYQLILAGPIAAAVLKDAPFHGVDVPVPTSMDTLALIDQAVTKLDRYLAANGFPPIPLPLREMMISAISARLLDGAIRADCFTRQHFDGWLRETILLAYPNAVAQRLTTNCDVLWNSLEIISPPNLGQRAFDVALPITFVNASVSFAIVEWVLLRVTGRTLRMLYRPYLLGPSPVDPASVSVASLPFGEIAVGPSTAMSVRLLLTPVVKPGFDVASWSEGEYELELWVKYASSQSGVRQREATITLTIDDRACLQSSQGRHIALSSLDAFLETL